MNTAELNKILSDLDIKFKLNPNKCVFCEEDFSSKNIFTKLGWKESKISGICEKCFEEAFKDNNDY